MIMSNQDQCRCLLSHFYPVFFFFFFIVCAYTGPLGLWLLKPNKKIGMMNFRDLY